MSAERQMFSPPFSPSLPGVLEASGGVEPPSSPLSETESLRMFVSERLAAAVDDILGEFVRTVSRYREQVERQRTQLELLKAGEGAPSPAAGRRVSAPCGREEALHPGDRPLCTGSSEEAGRQSKYVQQLVEHEEEVPTEQQQERSTSVDQEEPPEPRHIKEEREELGGLEEADSTKFSSSAVKREEDGAARCFNPDKHLQPVPPEKTSQWSECETDDSCEWEESRPNPLHGGGCNTVQTSGSSSECAVRFGLKGCLQKHSGIQTGVKPFSCSVCGKTYSWKKNLLAHMRLHSDGKHFSCSVCKKTFTCSKDIMRHMRMHTGEKPFSCTVCGTRFAHSSSLTKHLRVHTGEKPFGCSVCKLSFRVRESLVAHMRVHTV